MILNKEKTIKAIVSWLKDYLEKTSFSCFILPIDNDVNSVLTYLLCKLTNHTVYAFDPFFPWKRSEDTREYMPADGHVKMDPSLEDSWHNCFDAFEFAEEKKCLWVDSLDREEYRLLRNYPKKAYFADLLPLADLYKSELHELISHFYDETWVQKDKIRTKEFASRDIEWADRLDMNYSIISSDNDPVSNHLWPTLTGNQQKIIAKMHQIEKKTRHKHNPNLPVCKLRDNSMLVR